MKLYFNYLRLKLENKVTINIIWLFFDRLFRLSVGFIVSIFVTRYLGLEDFGKWNYVIAIIGLLSIISTLGLEQIIVKELLNKRYSEYILLGSMFFLRITGAIICLILLIIIHFIFKKDVIFLYISLILGFNLISQSIEVIDCRNQSNLQSKKTVIIKNYSFAIISIIKCFFIFFKFNLLMFVSLTLIESIFVAIGFIYNYGLDNLKKWKIDFNLIIFLLKESWPLIFSSIIIILYMRIDQIMIGEYLGNKNLGLYSISTKFTEIWYFIPSIFVTSFFPKLNHNYLNNKFLYYKNLLKLFKFLFKISFIISIIFFLFSNNIIEFLYGFEFLEASKALKISIFTGIFVFWGVAAGNVLVIENLNKHNFLKSILSLLINIILNIFLIPKYGITGAAISTLIAQFFSSFLYFFFFKKTRHISLLMIQSIFK